MHRYITINKAANDDLAEGIITVESSELPEGLSINDDLSIIGIPTESINQSTNISIKYEYRDSQKFVTTEIPININITDAENEPDYSTTNGLLFESLDNDLNITLTGDGDIIAFNYKTADSIDSLSSKEYTEIESPDSINETISVEKYTQFNFVSHNLLELTVSTDKQFNLIGDIAEFISPEVGYQNIVKPFKNNTNLKELINFKINYHDRLNRSGVDENGNWSFWMEQFLGCTNLESADIIFDLPNFPPDDYDQFYAKITNLFTKCTSLSYIRVKDKTQSFMAQFASNDWLDVNTLPDNGILILPTGYKLNNDIPGVVTSADEVNDLILSYDRVQTLLNKSWTIKFED